MFVGLWSLENSEILKYEILAKAHFAGTDWLLNNGPPKKCVQTKFGAIFLNLLEAMIVPFINRYDIKKKLF